MPKLMPVSLPRITLRLGIAAIVVVAVGACATTLHKPSTFLSPYNKLRTTSLKNVAAYRAPSFDPKAYGPVTLTPTKLHSATKRLADLGAELQQEVLHAADDAMASWLVAGASGGSKSLLARAAITDVDTPNRTLNIVSSLLLGPLTSGGASVELEVTDASSGDAMLAATCTERGSVIWQFTGAYSVLAHAKHAIAECMRHFERLYKHPSIDPPSVDARESPTPGKVSP